MKPKFTIPSSLIKRIDVTETGSTQMWFLPLRHTTEIITHPLHTHLDNKFFTDTEPVPFLKDVHVVTWMKLISGKTFVTTWQRRTVGLRRWVDVPSQTDVCCDWNCGPGCAEVPIREDRSQRHERTRIWLRWSRPGNVTSNMYWCTTQESERQYGVKLLYFIFFIVVTPCIFDKFKNPLPTNALFIKT
jgi:hypothetical protein